jgi:hypothetical protein
MIKGDKSLVFRRIQISGNNRMLQQKCCFGDKLRKKTILMGDNCFITMICLFVIDLNNVVTTAISGNV